MSVLPATIVYHGLGYVGLTGACHFVAAGVNVIGFDPDAAVVAAVNSGKPKAGEFLGYLGGDGTKLPKATTDFDAIARHGIHFIAVPSERNDQPDMTIVKDVVMRLLASIPSGGTIVIESTLTPGTIDEIVEGPCGQRVLAGEVFLIHAPRRDWFADADKNLGKLPRVVGAYNVNARAMAQAILSIVTPSDKLLFTDHQTAELVKPLENALFYMPIALGHAMAVAYAQVDVAEALRLAATHWRFESFGGLYIGLAAGGRCVPMGPKYLLAAKDGALTLLDLALDANVVVSREIAIYAVETDAVSVTILGMAYRPDFADLGGSPGLMLAHELRRACRHVTVRVHDPFLAGRVHLDGFEVVTDVQLPTILGASDIVVVATPHDGYAGFDGHVTWRDGQTIFDARGCWRGRGDTWPEGVSYRQIGTPGWCDIPDEDC